MSFQGEAEMFLEGKFDDLSLLVSGKAVLHIMFL